MRLWGVSSFLSLFDSPSRSYNASYRVFQCRGRPLQPQVTSNDQSSHKLKQKQVRRACRIMCFLIRFSQATELTLMLLPTKCCSFATLLFFGDVQRSRSWLKRIAALHRLPKVLFSLRLPLQNLFWMSSFRWILLSYLYSSLWYIRATHWIWGKSKLTCWHEWSQSEILPEVATVTYSNQQ